MSRRDELSKIREQDERSATSEQSLEQQAPLLNSNNSMAQNMPQQQYLQQINLSARSEPSRQPEKGILKVYCIGV